MRNINLGNLLGKPMAALALLALLTSISTALSQTELSLWFDGTSAQAAFMEEAAAEYNEMQDAVQITVSTTPPSRERIATALVGGTGPDLMWYNHNMPWFFGIEAVYPLNDFVTDPEIGIDPEQLFPASREAVQYAGVVQAVPVWSFPGSLIYNREMFRDAGLSDDDAPETWADVEAIAMQLAERDNGQVTRWGLVNSSVDWMLQELLLSNGGDWVAEDLSQYVSCSECLIEGLQWWHDLHHEHMVMSMPHGVTWAGTEAMQTGHEAFIREDAAMAGFMGVGTAATFLDENPDLDLGAVLTPLGPSANGVRTISPGFDGLFVMADAADPREGYLFIKWFFENKVLDFVGLTPGAVPSTTAALEDPAILEDPLLNRVIPAMQEARLRSFHVFPGRLDVRAEEPGMAEGVLLGRVTPEDAVEGFLQHAQRVFELYAEDLEEFLADHDIVW